MAYMGCCQDGMAGRKKRMEVRKEGWIVAQQSRIALTLSIGVVT